MADNCSICQGSFETPKFLKCGHTFCKTCLDSLMSSSFRKEFIVCPLCRAKTPYSVRGAESLMDNFIASDTTKRNSIGVCAGCQGVTYGKLCDHCNSSFCDICFSSHEVIEKSDGKSMKSENEDLEVDAANDEEDSRSTMGLQGFFLSDTTVTKFCFELKGRIVVPNSNPNERGVDINVCVLHAFDVDKCIVAPDRSNVLIYYNIKGEEIRRAELAVNIIDITIGIRGYPLLLDDATNNVYEVEGRSLKQIIKTFGMSPYALSSLNNGRIVIVGRNNNSGSAGMIQIYEQYGQRVRTICGSGEGFTLGILQSVDINRKNNEIYVADLEAGIIYRFQEHSTFKSSCFILETLANLNIDIPGAELSLVAPVPLCYDQTNDVVVASCMCPISRSILVLSPDLYLLGFFSSKEQMGVPLGLSVDAKGQLYIGDGMDGVIRVFAISEFKNNINRR